MMTSRATERFRRTIAVAALSAGMTLTTPGAVASPEEAAPAPAALPAPNPFVSGLDLECFRTPGPALNRTVVLSHLNPVLAGLAAHQVIVRELVETCVPVMKNGVPPPAAALPFIRHVDLACYRVDAQPLPTPFPLVLRHLNPLFANFPIHNVRLLRPQTLCLPVAKNTINPPPEVLNLVRFLDLECYRVDAGPHPSFGVGLSQLNPQLAGIPVHGMSLVPTPRQVCVPVRKNQQPIPADVLSLIRWVDLERFAASPVSIVLPQVVMLRHLNPLFANEPPVNVVLEIGQGLMLPVSKNGAVPPG
jgi:hypothetical protein